MDDINASSLVPVPVCDALIGCRCNGFISNSLLERVACLLGLLGFKVAAEYNNQGASLDHVHDVIVSVGQPPKEDGPESEELPQNPLDEVSAIRRGFARRKEKGREGQRAGGGTHKTRLILAAVCLRVSTARSLQLHPMDNNQNRVKPSLLLFLVQQNG